MAKVPDLSVIVTSHREGLLAHKTMRSIERALAPLKDMGVAYEILISIDRGDKTTVDYFQKYQASHDLVSVYQWDFGDLSQSRNAIIKKSHGRFISLIDADDLMSGNWLSEAMTRLLAEPYGSHIAHTAMTLEFGGARSIVQKYGHTNHDQDILLSVWSARWNSVIIAPRTIFEKYQYEPNSPGFGYEDWHMSMNFLMDDIKNITIPETAIFVRRKLTGSEWERQKTSRSVLHAHPVFKPSYFQSLDLAKVNVPKTQVSRGRKAIIKQRLIEAGVPINVIKRPLNIARKIKHRISHVDSHAAQQQIPEWLNTEWRSIHKIEKQIFPLAPLPQTYHTITDDHYQVGLAYWEFCQQLNRDNYDYVLFVPWIKAGGADLFAINYANTMASLSKNVLVIATNDTSDDSPWKHKLDKNVSFISFGSATQGFGLDQQYRLLEQLIENLGISTLHILNSELGYFFVRDHSLYLKASGKKIIATSYSQSIDGTGYVFGFSHTHIPEIYDQLDYITTDNDAVKAMWVDEYFYDPKKILIHHQPHKTEEFPQLNPGHTPTHRILWAARLAPEKIPNIVSHIAKKLPEGYSVDMYGHDSPEFSRADLKTSQNVHHKGVFDRPVSISVNDYDLYLYTSLFDGMPNTPVEFSFTGMPIVASAVGGLPGFIGNDGYVVEDAEDADAYAEQILKVYEDYSVAMKKAKRLQARAKNLFSQANFTREIEELIQLLNRKG